MGSGSPSMFGVLLRRFREAAGLSQERLAERAGLSPRGISDLERGARTMPRLETVRLLADGLDLDDADRAAFLAARGALPEPSASGSDGPWTALPRTVTSFIGRTAEIETIAQLLEAGEARLITLVGPGGVGKTRIALEVANRLARESGEEAVFIDLSPVRDASLVLPAIANRLGIPDSGGQDVLEVLAVALRGRETVMVLDNLEQVVDAAIDIAALLETSPTLKILATSRNVLRIAAEQVVPVEPLALPDGEMDPALSTLADVDSVALFVARARAADSAFALTEANAGAVVSLVNRLEGLPLAIELAAARIRMFALDDMLDRLGRQLPLLTGGPRDAPERQQTMRNTIAWSHELLSPAEQVMFRRLAIFDGGFTLEAAGSVIGAAGEITEHELLDGVNSLVDNSLVKRRKMPDGSHRYLMLQTVREFGIERLEMSGEEQAVRDAAHEHWFAMLAGNAEFLFSRADQVEWLNRLETEYVSLRGHIAWLIEQDRIEDALDISGKLWFFRWIRGYYAEARQQYETLLAHPAAQARTLERGRTLIGLGIISSHQGDIEMSLDVFREAIELFRELDEQRYLSLAWMGYGVSWMFIGQIDQAEEATRSSLEIARAAGDDAQIQGNLNNLSNIAASRGEWERARELLEEALAIGEVIGDTWGVALESMNLGSLLLREGELDRAEGLFRAAARLIADLGDKRDMPGLYWLLAEVARQRGDLGAAAGALEQSLGIARDIGDSQMIASALSGLAQLAHSAGDWDTALVLTRQSIRAFDQYGDMIGAAGCLDVLADIALATGAVARAAWCIGANEGVLARHGVSRMEMFPGEYQARVDSAIEALGEEEYRVHWERGRAMEPAEILAEALAWEPRQLRATPAEGSDGSDDDDTVVLSPGEIRILRLVVDGMTDAEIAADLQMSRQALASHTSELFSKLNVGDRVEAATVAVRMGMLHPGRNSSRAGQETDP